MELKTNKPDLLILRDRPWYLHLGFLALVGLTVFLIFHAYNTVQPTGYLLAMFPASIAAFMVLYKDRYTLTFDRKTGYITVLQVQYFLRRTRIIHDLSEVRKAVIGVSGKRRRGSSKIIYGRVVLVIPKGQSQGEHPASGWAQGSGTKRMIKYINAWLDSAATRT